MRGARRYLAIFPEPKSKELMILCMEAKFDPEGVKLKDLVDGLWPWEEGPRGSVTGATYQLSSDQQHRIGVHGLYCLYETEELETSERIVPGRALFFRTRLPGRALLLGVENGRVALLHDIQAREANTFFCFMQQTWGDRYHVPPQADGEIQEGPHEPPLH